MDHQILTTGLFLAVVALTIGITFWASRQTSGAADYYTGGAASPASRTVSPSAVTTCRPPRSSASPAPSR